MLTPLAGERWHMRRPLADHRRVRRYRLAGGMAPPRAVPLPKVEVTPWALGPVPEGWRPRRHWILKGYTPPPAIVREPTKPKPESRQLALAF